MKLPLISSIALAAAMLVSGPAMAQTVIAGATITAEELPYVQAQCDTLARVDNTAADPSAAAGTKDDDDQANGDADEPNDDSADTAPDAGDPAQAAKQLVTSIDLDVLTLEDCKTAGLVQ